MKETPPPRIIVRIELTEHARDEVTRQCERNGMTQLALLSTVVAWFSRQPDVVRASVLGHLPGEEGGDVATEVLRRMADGGGRTATRKG